MRKYNPNMNPLSLFDEKYVHCAVCDDSEETGKHCQSYDISPQGEIIKTKGTENTGSRYFNVKSISMILET